MVNIKIKTKRVINEGLTANCDWKVGLFPSIIAFSFVYYITRKCHIDGFEDGINEVLDMPDGEVINF